MSFHLVNISKQCKLTSSDSKHISSWLEQGVGRREGWLDGIRKFLWWWVFVIFDWGGGFKGTYVKTKRYICYKVGLKLNIQKTKIMASGPIISWQIDGETMETLRDFIFLGSKITADGDCSHEIKRCLLLWKKVMTNIDSILKSRDITLLTKLCLVKAIVFPVLMYGCEN